MKQPQQYSRSFRYGDKEIAFNFWLATKDGLPPDTIIFLGAGQVGSIPRWVARSAGSGVIVVDGLPHWESHPSGHDTAQFAIAYVQSAFEVIQKEFGLRELNVIAESQAALATVILARTVPDMIRNVVLARPVGFSVRAFGATDQERLRVFRRRILQTAFQLIHHPRNLAIAMIMLRAMLREPSLTALNKKYAVGISYDLSQDYKQVAESQKRKGHSLVILLGDRDRLFPSSEILAAFKALQLDDTSIRIVPKTGHASFATPSSRALLGLAIDIVREKEINS